MKIIINNNAKNIEEFGLTSNNITVAQLSQKLSEHPSSLAIIVNSTFISRNAWSNTILKENDQIETISLIAGG